MKQWLPLLIGFFGTVPWWGRALLSQRLQNMVDGYLNPSAIRWLGIIAILASFILANYFAWEGEHKEVSNLSYKLNKLEVEATPNITGTIERVIILKERLPEKNLRIDITATLRNVGAPSAAEGFLLKVYLKNGQIITGEKIFPYNNQETHYDSGIVETISSADLLDRKATQPIPRGGMIMGRMFYRVNTSIDSISGSEATFEITFYDILGKEIIMKIKPAFRDAEPIQAFPGLEMPNLKNIPKPKP